MFGWLRPRAGAPRFPWLIYVVGSAGFLFCLSWTLPKLVPAATIALVVAGGILIVLRLFRRRRRL